MRPQFDPRKSFSVPLRPDERRKVEDAAATEAERPATWARAALLAAARQVLATAPAPQAREGT